MTVISNGQLSAIANPQWAMAPMNWTDPLVFDSRRAPDEMWRSQPSVRKVVDFIARALASTPLKLYDRVSDVDRKRITDHPLAGLLSTPRPGSTAYRFWYSVIVDWMLWDRWCVTKTPDGTVGGRKLARIPARRFVFEMDLLDEPLSVKVSAADGQTTELPLTSCVYDFGYGECFGGTSPMYTLRDILDESREAVAYRRSMWQRGARIPAVISRPAGPKWDEKAKERFVEGWRAYAKDGGREGGTPILEDGMTIQKFESFSPRDTKDIEGRQLNDAEVASAYQIAPELVGARQGTYSNVDAFRQMKYRDSLGPYYVAWEQALNAYLRPEWPDADRFYIEADIDSKLRGSFDEQAAFLQTAVGAPWLTRNEGRARQNLPAVDGGDELITPLNVIEGGQASPTDSGSQNLG